MVGLSVLKTSRGPECIQPTVVRAMFNIKQPLKLETVQDEMLNSIIDSIKKRNFDALLDASINLLGKLAKELIQLYYLCHVILTKFDAIEQFKLGITSIYPGFCGTASYEAMRIFLETNSGGAGKSVKFIKRI